MTSDVTNLKGAVNRRNKLVRNIPSDFSSLSGTNDSHQPNDVNSIPVRIEFV